MIVWTAALLIAGLWATPSAVAQPKELPLGSKLPMSSQALMVASGGQKSLNDLKGSKGTVLLFWSNECPWVDKYEDRVQKLVSTYTSQGIGFVFVNSNDPVAFPSEAAEASKKRAGDKKYPVYVLDEGSKLANALGASRTPSAFIFDGNGALAYVGTIDDSPGDPSAVGKTYLKDALDAVTQGQAVGTAKTKSFGCTLKFQ